MDDRHERGIAWAFWARVEDLRINAGMQKVELQRISGVRRQTYMELKRTKRRPRRDIVLKLAAAVDLDADEALQLAGLSAVDADTVRRTVLGAHDLSREQKAALLALLEIYEQQDTGSSPTGTPLTDIGALNGEQNASVAALLNIYQHPVRLPAEPRWRRRLRVA